VFAGRPSIDSDCIARILTVLERLMVCEDSAFQTWATVCLAFGIPLISRCLLEETRASLWWENALRINGHRSDDACLLLMSELVANGLKRPIDEIVHMVKSVGAASSPGSAFSQLYVADMWFVIEACKSMGGEVLLPELFSTAFAKMQFLDLTGIMEDNALVVLGQVKRVLQRLLPNKEGSLSSFPCFAMYPENLKKKEEYAVEWQYQEMIGRSIAFLKPCVTEDVGLFGPNLDAKGIDCVRVHLLNLEQVWKSLLQVLTEYLTIQEQNTRIEARVLGLVLAISFARILRNCDESHAGKDAESVSCLISMFWTRLIETVGESADDKQFEFMLHATHGILLNEMWPLSQEDVKLFLSMASDMSQRMDQASQVVIEASQSSMAVDSCEFDDFDQAIESRTSSSSTGSGKTLILPSSLISNLYGTGIGGDGRALLTALCLSISLGVKRVMEADGSADLKKQADMCLSLCFADSQDCWRNSSIIYECVERLIPFLDSGFHVS
jgi:hypothetical protein